METFSLTSLSSILALLCWIDWIGLMAVLIDLSDLYVFGMLLRRASKLLLPEPFDLFASLFWLPLVRLRMGLVTSFPTYDLIILGSKSLFSFPSFLSLWREGFWCSFHIHWRSSRIAVTFPEARSMILNGKKDLRWWWLWAVVDWWRWGEHGNSFLFQGFLWHLSWACWGWQLWGKWCQRSGRTGWHRRAVRAFRL